jgi:bifunctional DNase/RNase
MNEIEFLTEITDKTQKTFYLFDREQKVLLPLESPLENSTGVAWENQHQSRLPETRGNAISTHRTLEMILKAVGARILQTKIYLHQEGVYYTYLMVEQAGRLYEVNIPCTDAVEIARRNKLPIYVTEEILKECGIAITKELLQEALNT